MTALVIGLAALLDRLLGEPRRWHPLVGFGRLANRLEARCNANVSGRLAGVMALSFAVAPFVLIAFAIEYLLRDHALALGLVSTLLVYLAIGWQSLLQHAQAVSQPLARGDIDGARSAVAMLVSRDTATMTPPQVAAAATESVLENGADGALSAIFWYCLAGLPGLVAYRLVNTLDAMWGYRNARYADFGWASARCDDLLNLAPARLTALSYALLGHTRLALRCWRAQAASWKSPNAGPVMAAGAGAINTSLGGSAVYDGQLQQRPPLGPQATDACAAATPSAATIEAAGRLVSQSILLWWLLIALGATL